MTNSTNRQRCRTGLVLAPLVLTFACSAATRVPVAALSDTKVMNISFVDSAGNCVLTEYDKEKKVNKTEDDSLVVRIANACTAKTADLTIKSKSKYVTCDGQAAGAYAGAFQVNPAKKAYVDCLLVYGKEQELKIRLVAVKGSELGLEVEP